MPEPKTPSRSIQISSNFTLFFKIVIPVFWVVFFGLFTMSAVTTEMYLSFGVPKLTFQVVAVVLYALGVLFIYFTFWQLKRVEFFPDTFFVTNYFKHYRYSYPMIESISYIQLLIFKIMIIKLAQKGHFGQYIPVLISRKRHQIFIETLPEIAQQIGLK